MVNQLLLPAGFKKIGWLIFIPATIAGIALAFQEFDANWVSGRVFAIINDSIFEKDRSFQFIRTNITNTLVGTLFLVGGLLVAFSKEKEEDEFISGLRLSSLQWAVLLSYGLLLLGFLFIYGLAFMNVMIYNMFTVLVIFIARFNYLLYKSKTTVSDEK